MSEKPARDPNCPSAFLPGSMEEWFWNRWPTLPPMPPAEQASRDALVDRWVQDGRDRTVIEIITR